ncbi:MAG: extracellular solute-binding protein family 1 [Paenibacillus sp.]|nr:extracellular solute-binding protein family 1 [Paenibacillus sp.]
MKQKRWLPLLLVSALSTSLLAACSDSDGKKSADSDNANGEAKKKFTITMLANDGQTLPYSKEAKAGDRYSQELSRLYSEYSKQDVTIQHEWLDGNNYKQLLTVRFASGELPDIIQTAGINDTSHPNAVENGIFLELNDLLDKYGSNIKKKFPADIWKDSRLSKNGKIYGLPMGSVMDATQVVFIRQDWLDKLGMKTPVTVDDYLAYFEAVKTKDVNGNGDPNDEIPFGTHENLGQYNALFFGGFGAHPNAWSEVNGQIIPDLINPKMKDVLSFWKMIYDKGYTYKDMFTKPNADKWNDIYADKVGMWLHDVQNIDANWSASNFTNKNVKLDVLPGPANAKGETRLIPESSGIRGVRVLNAKTKNAKEIIQFLDWTLSDDPKKNTFFSFGIEGYNHTVENGKIKYDANAPANLDKGQSSMFQTMLYPLGDNRMSPEIISLSPSKDLIQKGVKVAAQAAYVAPSKYMPPLDAVVKNPELADRAGTLYLDMFAKVITGKEELEPAFTKFVAEWKKRGGDDAIKQANEWYKEFTKK